MEQPPIIIYKITIQGMIDGKKDARRNPELLTRLYRGKPA
jgi:hypothetical protein